MKTYDEITFEEVLDPDLSVGYIYPGRRFVAHHDAVEEQSHFEVLPGTEALNGGKGLRGKVVDVPAKAAWDEYEDCMLYHRLTEDEPAALRPPDPPDTAATWDELAAACSGGVSMA